MKAPWILAVVVVILVPTSWYAWHKSRPSAEAPVAEEVVKRSDVQLTIYGHGLGLVHEQRPAALVPGANWTSCREVSGLLNPKSILLQWNSDQAEVVSYGYDQGAESEEALLRRYNGKPVDLVRYADNGHEAERQSGLLMMQQSGGMMLQDRGRLYVRPRGTIVTPSGSTVSTSPAVSVESKSRGRLTANLGLTYITGGLSWTPDYVASVSPDASSMRLECWATVTNKTGVAYPGAKLMLVDGTPAKHGESSEFPIQSPSTILSGQLNRVSLFTVDHIDIQRDYSALLPQLPDSLSSSGDLKSTSSPMVELALAFKNRAINDLPKRLLRGPIRAYQSDDQGAIHYLGAGRIPVSEPGEKVYLPRSSAPEISVASRVICSHQISGYRFLTHVRVTVHNGKSEPVPVRLVQPLDSRWTITRETSTHLVVRETAAQWTVTVPAMGTAEVDFEAESVRG